MYKDSHKEETKAYNEKNKEHILKMKQNIDHTIMKRLKNLK
jgi:hypothetical protein